VRIPTETRDLLSPYVPADTPWDVDVRLRVPHSLSAALPSSRIPRPVMAVTARSEDRALLAIGQSFDGVVVLHPRFADLETAAGLSLLGHEMVHQQQFSTIPKFLAAYSAAARDTPKDRPWENPFEFPAYEAERNIYCRLVADGFPPGNWTPLGVQLWGC